MLCAFSHYAIPSTVNSVRHHAKKAHGLFERKNEHRDIFTITPSARTARGVSILQTPRAYSACASKMHATNELTALAQRKKKRPFFFLRGFFFNSPADW